MQNEQMLRVMGSCGLTAALIAAASAVASLLLLGRKWRSPHQAMAAMGAVAGASAAAYLGCALLDVLPHWPPKEIEPRFLYLVLPAAIAIELAAAIPQVPRWIAWCLRVLLAATAGRVLLDKSRYLVDSDPDLPPWTTEHMLLILGGFATAPSVVKRATRTNVLNSVELLIRETLWRDRHCENGAMSTPAASINRSDSGQMT